MKINIKAMLFIGDHTFQESSGEGDLKQSNWERKPPFFSIGSYSFTGLLGMHFTIELCGGLDWVHLQTKL